MAEGFEEKDAEREKDEKSEKEYTKPSWLDVRHSWYANLNISLKQLDIFIGIACGALAVVFVLIALDAMNII